jgi:hypothetical protein
MRQPFTREGYAESAPCACPACEGAPGEVRVVHFVPNAGRRHVMSRECWCHPDFNGDMIVIHHTEH